MHGDLEPLPNILIGLKSRGVPTQTLGTLKTMLNLRTTSQNQMHQTIELQVLNSLLTGQNALKLLGLTPNFTRKS